MMGDISMARVAVMLKKSLLLRLIMVVVKKKTWKFYIIL